MRTCLWYPLLNKLLPIRQHADKTGIFVENILQDIIKNNFRGTSTPMHILRADPRAKNPGVLWHMSNTMEDYKQLFKKYGLIPDSDFSVKMSGSLANFKIG
jgi:hypothetical protein